MTELSDQESIVANALHARHDNDVSIEELHRLVYGCVLEDNHKRMQQRIGAIVSRINKKLSGEAITTGQLKRTYRMIEYREAS